MTKDLKFSLGSKFVLIYLSKVSKFLNASTISVRFSFKPFPFQAACSTSAFFNIEIVNFQIS